jgi:hypothetical protein
MVRVLFLLKRRPDFNSVIHNKIGVSTGLYNSANFVNTMLNKNNIESKVIVAIDNNDIDREVTSFKPTHVILEALWVVPAKFAVLQKIHPMITWIVRLHSEMPFMAGESIAMDWIGDYINYKNVLIACNSPRMLSEIRNYLKIKSNLANEKINNKVIYLPNYYPQEYKIKSFNYRKDIIDIGCFGAIRPLKNHLMQAHAALQFADMIGKKLKFHVNAGRIEMKGEPMINNLKGMFQQLAGTGHEMINHQWVPREDFLSLCASMDLGLQVSFTETFNIVAADLISQGVPVIGSEEIPWLNSYWCASPTQITQIIDKLYKSYCGPNHNIRDNQTSLFEYTSAIPPIWLNYFPEYQNDSIYQ